MKTMKRVVLILVLVSFVSTGAMLWAQSPVEKGKKAFKLNGCIGCHRIGTEWNGPDLTGITTYRSREWIIDFTLHTEKYYDDPIVRAMIERFKLYMPNQGVEPKDAELIYEYLKSLEKPVEKKKDKK